jgi:transcriptional regulator
MSDQDLASLISRMNYLLANVATQGLQLRDAIPMLARAGYTQTEIANILGTTKNAVNLTQLRLRKSAVKKSAKKRTPIGKSG